MATVVSVLRSGGDYKPEHVQRLARQVPGLICLSDVPIDGVQTIPLKTEWPGWWAKIEICRPDIAGDVMYFDLDTTVYEIPTATETTVLQDFNFPRLMGSGLMYLSESDRDRCWQAFIKDPKGIMASCTKWPRWGDQGFFQDHIGGANKWGPDVVSYKLHCRKGVPKGTKVVCFHGKPRPWDLKHGI